MSDDPEKKRRKEVEDLNRRAEELLKQSKKDEKKRTAKIEEEHKAFFKKLEDTRKAEDAKVEGIIAEGIKRGVICPHCKNPITEYHPITSNVPAREFTLKKLGYEPPAFTG